MTKDEISERVHSLFTDAKIDIAGEDCNFEITVVSSGFEGQGLLARQKLILALFKEDITSGALHAISVKAKTPSEIK